MGLLVFSVFVLSAEPAANLRIEAGQKPIEIKVVARLPSDLRAKLPEGKLTQEAGERYLQLTLLADDGTEGPAILGSYERSDEQLTFVPRFALMHGGRYRATLTLGEKKTSIEHRAPDRPASTPAVVEAIYPSTDEAPANLLKFYIHFSRPMREGKDIFDRIQILDESGKPVEDPWRRTELWNDDATRLTLWIHPGRIKKGVNLREEIGPVLEPQRRYSLVIGNKLLDSEGQPLGKPFTKSFRTTASVQKAIDLAEWKIKTAAVETKEAVEVKFPRPLDRALLQRCLTVIDAGGKPVPGRSTIGAAELTWLFKPEQPWKAGNYSLAVDEGLEDLAGNTLLGPFDVDRKLPAVKNPQRTIPFLVRN